MGIKDFFIGDDMAKLDYLEEERKKIWAKIVEIESDLQKKTADYENEAKQSSKKASEFRNRSEASQQAALEYLTTIKTAYDEINGYIESAKSLNSTISEIKTNCTNNLETTKSSYDEIVTLETTIREKVPLGNRCEEFC
jgi:uncharacterized coiled-coil DUF342 family protein